MDKIIRLYETIFIIDTNLAEDAIKALIEKFTSLISANGTLEKVDEWGKRKLAYEINDRTEGYYVLANFKSSTDFPKELERIFKITDGIIRSIIVNIND